MIKVKVFAVNPFREVTYVVTDEVTKEAVVIDSGLLSEKEIERFDDYIEKQGIKLVAAVNTHLHVDHILGVSYVLEKYNIPFAASSKDAPLLKAAHTSARMFQMVPKLPFVSKLDLDLTETKTITFGESTLEVIDTPGHTKGGVCLYNSDSKVLFTGDTLFKGSIGRTDLEGGDYDELMRSIFNNIIPLGGDVTVFPGHGDHSTLAQEAQHNPFLTDVLNGEVNYCK